MVWTEDMVKELLEYAQEVGVRLAQAVCYRHNRGEDFNPDLERLYLVSDIIFALENDDMYKDSDYDNLYEKIKSISVQRFKYKRMIRYIQRPSSDLPISFLVIALDGTDITSSSFTANWQVSGYAEGYLLDVATDENFENFLSGYENLDVGDVTEYEIDDLCAGTNYYYRVRAYRGEITSDYSNIISVKTDYVYDYDGNAYSSIKIGNQEWMVENLRVTHYRDGSPIVNMIYNTWQNQAASWTNGYGGYSFDTFTTSGNDITSGIKAPGDYGYAVLNETVNLNAGDYIYYNINVTINSGSGLYVVLFKNDSPNGWQGLSNGSNEGGFIIMSSGTYTLGICTLTTAGIDFSATFQMADNYHKGWANADYGCYCWYNNDINYKDPYGALYNWYAVVDTRGLVPEGWRIPTVEDFQTLHDYFGAYAGGKLKETGTDHWNPPNTGATNESGFTAVGNGWRSSTGLFTNLKNYGTLWSQSERSTLEGYRPLLYAGSYLFNYNNYTDKREGCVVRCIKDT